ncbi:MAG: hypothetical protein KDB32_09025 [Planctomycetes bacterium]|nr:hypothetical protein [Planctomycetota bacterium]
MRFAMFKTALLVVLVSAVGTSLFAGGLMETLLEQKVADDWYKHFQAWVEGECQNERFPETHFDDNDGALHPYRITGVGNGKLVCVELLGAQREPAKVTTSFDWDDWEPRFIAGTYPVKTNEDTLDVIAFAAWLYLHAENPLLANRVLTVVYERDPNMQDAIAEYIRGKDGLSDKERLVVVEYWHSEFQKWRRVLLPKDKAKQLEDDRKGEGLNGVKQLAAEYNDAENRDHTLAEIAYLLEQWQIKFADTEFFKKQNPVAEKTLNAINKDIAKIDVYLDSGSKLTDLAERAAEYEKALNLDPRSLLLLSKAANTWMEHANPEVVGGRFKCTKEQSARRAIELFQRSLERNPDDFKVLLNLGVCHHVVGSRDKAGACYKRIRNDCEDASLVKLAKSYDDMP